MMISIKVEENYDNLFRYLPIYFPLGVLIGLTFLLEILSIVSVDLVNFQASLSIFDFSELVTLVQYATTIQALALPLYVYLFHHFFLASFILLVAMISAIVLTMSRGTPAKAQEIYVQNLRGSKILLGQLGTSKSS
jgi:NADH:ubiquinone oxidoreductase subunit 6 (subunit J)